MREQRYELAPESTASVSAVGASGLSAAEVALIERTRRGMSEEAVPEKQPWEKFSLSVGGLLAAVDSSVRLGTPGLAVEVNVEEAFGFSSGVTSARVGGSWRFSDNRRHRMDLIWVDLSRNSDKTLSQELSLGNGVVLPVGADVSSEFRLQLYRTEYSYSFLQDERIDLAAVFGLYVMPIGFDFKATGVSTVSDSFDITAPLPLGGIRMDFVLTEDFYLRSALSLFYVEIDDYTGSMQDVLVACEWAPTEHFAVGLGLDSFRLKASVDGSSFVPGVGSAGSVELQYTGLTLYLKGRF